MKTRKLRLLSALLALAMLLALTPTAAFAAVGDTFEVGGLNYHVLEESLEKNVDESVGTVEVLGPPYANPQTVVIPGEVEHNGKKYKVVKIAEHAFMENGLLGHPLQSITLPDGLEEIEMMAFKGCENLAEISIPSTVTTIGEYAFAECKLLKEITIPATVTAISNHAFEGCKALTKVLLPSAVTTIGHFAFFGCEALTEISIPSNVTTIGNKAFGDCKALTKISIPANVTSLGKWCFQGCAALSTVTFAENSKVEKLDEQVFAQCSSLGKITIPSTVTAIGYEAFRECSNLTEVEFASGSKLSDVNRSAFQNCNENLKIKCDDKSIKDKLVAAGVSENSIEVPKVNVTLDYNGGQDADGKTTAEQQIERGDTVQAFTAPTRTGYTFGGWYKNAECTSKLGANETITENMILYAGWNINQYRVTFDAQGGEDEPASQTVAYNTFASEPVAPTKAGYTFGGWYTQDAEGKYAAEAFDFENTPITADTTVYAKWLLNAAPLIPATPVTYKVTVENGTARVLDENGDALVKEGESVTVQVGKTVTLKAADFSDSNMKFDRWEVRKGEVKLANDHAAETTFTMPAGDVELEAMPVTADTDDSSWDTATVVTGVVLGTGTAVLAYHIGMEVYAEQVLGKGVAVPKTRAEVALLAWQLAGKPEVAVEGEPLSEAAMAQKWAVESGLMQNDADGSFNPDKKMSKWKALRTLDAAKKMG